MTEPTSERIGLLFVHGMGEQKRWEHLTSSVLELAELMRETAEGSTVTLVDRTADWKWPPGERHPDGLAPVTLFYTGPDKRVTFECFEVWWADLGTRSGVVDTIGFWLWGLGQWSAPIYRELNAAGLPNDTRLTHLPKSVAGDLRKEPWARLQLLMAAVAAVFVVCTWSLAKRLLGAAIGKAPLPTLIVRYIGDVRTYEARAAPGDTAVTDPGHPRRVGIRRRMVTAMVEMATAGHDGWYVLAHSLGTVVAYNGLTETGQALPNYLPRVQWEGLHPDLKTDPGCGTRADVHAMMPARPPWLAPADVVDRPALFAKLRGFLTYGSPLDKFAGLWPRIVATATDRRDGRDVFPKDCQWVNLAAPTDPVAGWLDSFPAEPGGPLHGAVPPVRNYRAPWSWRFGLSHILYFEGFERFRRNEDGPRQKRAVADWILGRGLQLTDAVMTEQRQRLAVAVYCGMLAALWLVASVLLALILELFHHLIGGAAAAGPNLLDTMLSFVRLAGAVLGAALALILLTGLYRWARESALNVRLAEHDHARLAQQRAAQTEEPEQLVLAARLRRSADTVALLRRQRDAARRIGIALAVLLVPAFLVDAGAAPTRVFGFWTLLCGVAGTMVAVRRQAAINHEFGAPRGTVN